MILQSVNWRELFVPSQGLAELFLRGTVMYLFIFTLMRVFRREAGSLSIPDLLVVVLIADAAQNGMSGEYHSLTEGVVLVGTIFLWNYALDWLAYRYRWAYRLLNPESLLLVKDGRIIRRNLKAELLTVSDLLSQLREQGIEDIAEVKRTFIEPDGHLSVIKRKSNEEPQRRVDRNRGIS